MTAAIHAIRMPKFGLSMTEGKVAAWVVELGQAVAMGGDLVEIETEKITNVHESPVAGVLRRQLVELDTLLPVGTLIGIVADEGASDADIDAEVARLSEGASEVMDDERGPVIRALTLDVEGEPLRCLDAGQGDPILLVHGFSGDAESWQFNHGALAETHRVVAVDLPGHGGSSKSVGEGTALAFAGRLRALIAALDMGPVHLVGHSLGGAVALELAREAPDLVRSLTLIAPAGVLGEVNGEFVASMLAADRPRPMKAALSRLFADQGLVSTAMAENALRARRVDGAQAALETIAAANFAGQLTQRLSGALGGLSMPVQLIWGAEDAVLAAPAPDAHPRLTLIEGAGHMPQMEAAARVNRLIEELIAGGN